MASKIAKGPYNYERALGQEQPSELMARAHAR